MPETVQQKSAPSLTQAAPTDQPQLTVGMLYLGSAVHGVNRYGRMIAAQLRAVPGVSVIEQHHDLTRPGWRGVLDALHVPRGFRAADVVIVPYCTNGLWGSQRAKLAQLVTVLGGIRAPVVTVLHDVYSPGGRRRSAWWALALCTALPQATVIHGEHERPRLYRMPRAGRAQVIPHFIEHRDAISRDEARHALGVRQDARVLGVLGWIHPRKHYELAIRLLATLEQDFELWMIGSAPEGSGAYLDKLRALADELALAERVTVTGYVDEDELALRIAALNVGLCPYRDASASGSMSTLLSARRPLVANDFALAAELAELAPDAITLVSDTDMDAYRRAVVAAAAADPPPSAFDDVLEQRSPEAIAGRYVDTLRSVIA
jgi:glycosyltransferase involved in cell wall biosynthesis